MALQCLGGRITRKSVLLTTCFSPVATPHSMVLLLLTTYSLLTIVLTTYYWLLTACYATQDVEFILNSVDDVHNGLTFCVGSYASSPNNKAILLAHTPTPTLSLLTRPNHLLTRLVPLDLPVCTLRWPA